jgi:hypothetical protein
LKIPKVTTKLFNARKIPRRSDLNLSSEETASFHNVITLKAESKTRFHTVRSLCWLKPIAVKAYFGFARAGCTARPNQSIVIVIPGFSFGHAWALRACIAAFNRLNLLAAMAISTMGSL